MEVLSSLFLSPLSKEYCNWFYFLTVVSFIIMVIAAFSCADQVIRGNVDPVQALIAFSGPFLVYFSNRLLYSMCMGSLTASIPRQPGGFSQYATIS